MNTPMQELQLLLRQSPEIIYTEDLLQIIGYTFIEKERQLIKDSCEIAIMQWHEWDKPYSTADKYYTSTYGSKGSETKQ